MAYRFRLKDDTVAGAARRIAREQIGGAIGAIEGKDAAVAVHEVRKCCKKMRALVRLVRPVFPDYAQENADFRDIARALSGSRDVKVLLDTIDLLTQGAPEAAKTGLFAPLRRQLARDQAQQAPKGMASTHLDEARKRLEKALERSKDWSLQGEGWDALGGGLRRILRKARKAERAVHSEPSAANYHELRKLMKYHWYHTRLLVPLWPATMRPCAAELSRLADMLGLHHDICVLEEWLGAMPPSTERFDAVEAMLALARERRKQLERDIAPLVARSLAEKPQARVDHWGALWAIWRREAADEGA
ncbi:CHAD domain-containing protein [Novosphingobium endophyticum]|uniref:CHAD domain-containing protein n=1 Tax=Novosphingobium endophyticum TaxID=1955250 RepID=A0A916TTZ3_9SPHN|nr:CHAD domain-containing protein [Novosphingobium endophyticum]GGC08998.1 CHAD domain-containing protein [Novosphingobium endophyticum]